MGVFDIADFKFLGLEARFERNWRNRFWDFENGFHDAKSKIWNRNHGFGVWNFDFGWHFSNRNFWKFEISNFGGILVPFRLPIFKISMKFIILRVYIHNFSKISSPGIPENFVRQIFLLRAAGVCLRWPCGDCRLARWVWLWSCNSYRFRFDTSRPWLPIGIM